MFEKAASRARFPWPVGMVRGTTLGAIFLELCPTVDCTYKLYPDENHTSILVSETHFMLSHPWITRILVVKTISLKFVFTLERIGVIFEKHYPSYPLLLCAYLCKSFQSMSIETGQLRGSNTGARGCCGPLGNGPSIGHGPPRRGIRAEGSRGTTGWV
jgi:hypothetical protein